MPGEASNKVNKTTSSKSTGPSESTTTTAATLGVEATASVAIGSGAVLTSNKASDGVQAAMLVHISEMLVTASMHVDKIT